MLGESEQQDGGDGDTTQRVLQRAVSAGVPGDRTLPGRHRDTGRGLRRSSVEHRTAHHSAGEVVRRGAAAPAAAAVRQPTAAVSASSPATLSTSLHQDTVTDCQVGLKTNEEQQSWILNEEERRAVRML